jgi:hypothetical protein
MCHRKRYWEQRDERFEQELRELYDRQRERPEPPTPVLKREADEHPVAEPEREEVPTLRS